MEDFYQNDQPHYTETTTEEIDPVTGAKITRTVRNVTQTVTIPAGANEAQIRDSMQNVLDQFIGEERSPK